MGLAAPKSAKKQIVAHVSRKKIQARQRLGLSPASPPANFTYAWKTTQDMSSLVMGSGAKPRPKTVDLQRSPLMTANSSPVS